MDPEHDQTEEPVERTHTPEERAALSERIGEMVGYVNLLEAHDQALGDEMRAEQQQAEAAAATELDRSLAAHRVERWWQDIRQPVWWAIGVLLIGIVLAVIAFIGGGSDTTPATGGSEGAASSVTEEPAADAGAADDASGVGFTGTEGAPPAGDEEPVSQETADVEYLLDLAAEIVTHTGAANAAIDAGEKGEASTHLMAVKPLMTAYIDGGGDLVMRDFSEQQHVWLLAANSYVSGNTGAFADMQAAYDGMVAALEAYERAVASD